MGEAVEAQQKIEEPEEDHGETHRQQEEQVDKLFLR